jgi:hypothetical protein
MVERVESLIPQWHTELQRACQQWIEHGLRTGPAHQAAFESAARRCYEHAGIAWPGSVIWVGSPLVIAVAAPVAALLIQWRRRGSLKGRDGALGRVLREVVSAAAGRALCESAIRAARAAVAAAAEQPADTGDEVEAALGGAVDERLREVVHGVVDRAAQARMSRSAYHAMWRTVSESVSVGVEEAVGVPVDGAVHDVLRAWTYNREQVVSGVSGDMRIREALEEVILNAWPRYLGGQLGVGEVGRGPVLTAFLREVCGLRLPDDLWERSRAYETTFQCACWWYPHRDFLMACERPREIHLETPDWRWFQELPLSQLHRSAGPAVSWPDGWSVHAVHGRRLPGWIFEHPERLTVPAIEREGNAEVRRVLIETYGWGRFMRDCGARVVDRVPLSYPIKGLRGARLLRKELAGEPEPIVYLEMVNSTPEPDGSHRRYLERIDPKAYGGDAGRSCHAAMASRWRYRDQAGSLRLTFTRWQDYLPAFES